MSKETPAPSSSSWSELEFVIASLQTTEFPIAEDRGELFMESMVDALRRARLQVEQAHQLELEQERIHTAQMEAYGLAIADAWEKKAAEMEAEILALRGQLSTAQQEIERLTKGTK